MSPLEYAEQAWVSASAWVYDNLFVIYFFGGLLFALITFVTVWATGTKKYGAPVFIFGWMPGMIAGVFAGVLWPALLVIGAIWVWHNKDQI